MKGTCGDWLPALCWTGAVLSPSTDAHSVPLPTAESADVAGGAVGGAVQLVRDAKGIRGGVVFADASAGRPRHQSRVGVTVHRRLHAAVGTRN